MDEIYEYLRGHVEVINALSTDDVSLINRMADVIVSALDNGGKLLVMGNGGSAADAQHFAAEMVGRFQAERKAIPAVALTTDTSVLTAVANDYGFERIFSRQIEALARPGDVVFGISTSGQSGNILQALQAARSANCHLLCLSGQDGGPVAKIADLTLIVPSLEVPYIQEVHLTIIHLLCKLIEARFTSRS